MSPEITEEVQVTPVNRVKTRGEVHRYKYSFSSVHIEDIGEEDLDGIFQPQMSEASIEDGNIHYQYGDRPEIIIKDDGAYTKDDSSIDKAEEQAYFALSMLAGSGYVSNWRQER